MTSPELLTSTERAAKRLRAAFSAKEPDESEIRDAVCAYADSGKALGWPVERVIIDVKRIAEIEDGFLAHARRSRDGRSRLAEQVLERAVTWCIQHYFWTPPAD